MENLYNTYLFKAMDAYPYEIENAIEALNYALTYEPESVKALCLMARVQSEQLGNNKLAKEYYEKALSINLENPDIYSDYIRLLVNDHDHEEAQKLIDFAITVKGIDKAGIQLAQAYLHEAISEFEKAEEALLEAKILGLNNEFIYYVDKVISRVSKKRKIQNNKNREKEACPKKEIETKNINWFQNRLNNLL